MVVSFGRMKMMKNTSRKIVCNPIIENMWMDDRYAPMFLIGLIDHRAGAIRDKESPTGHISIHDNLPCIRWREDGVYSL